LVNWLDEKASRNQLTAAIANKLKADLQVSIMHKPIAFSIFLSKH